MNIIDLLIGKKVKIMTDAKVEVELEIQSIEEKVETHTEVIVPGTPENDWYGLDKYTKVFSYNVKFTNGFSKTYESLKSINIID